MYASQYQYDNATPPDASDYRDSSEFSAFAEFVALELLAGRDCIGIDSQIFMIDLELEGGGYQLALEWVSERVTEKQYRSWLDDLGYGLK